MLERVMESNDMNEEEIMIHYDKLNVLQTINNFFIDISQELCIGGKLLDIGCGTGQILRGMNDKYEKHGVDISQNMIEYARGQGHNIKYKIANGNNLPYKENSFDFVTCHSAMHHIKDPNNFINEMLRVLNPEGALFVKDLCRPQSEFQLQNFFMDYLAKNYDEINKKLFEDSLRASYTADEFKQLFQPDIKTNKLFFYNIANRPAKGIEINYQERQLKELQFIKGRIRL